MDTRKRKRGIKASREKLELAMLAKGYKTQRELAEQIAKNEGIKVPPKDLVNKAFREQAVSINNLNRIAKGLEVEPHSLYLSKDDVVVNEVLAKQNPSLKPLANESTFSNNNLNRDVKLSYIKLFSVGLVLLMGMILTSIWFNGKPSQNPPTNTSISSAIGKILVLVQSPDEVLPFAQGITEKFKDKENINLIVSQNRSLFETPANEVIEKGQVHALLRLNLEKGDIFQHLSLTISSDKHEAIIAQWIIREREISHNQEQMIEQAYQQIIRFIDGQPLQKILSNSKSALSNYLKGVDTLFFSHSLSNFVNANSYFEEVLKIDPKFIQAHALLCLSYVRMSWIKDELSLLENAAAYCQHAQKAAPNDIQTQIATFELYMKTGESEKAEKIAEKLTSQSFLNADVLAILAEFSLLMANNYPDASYNDAILNYVESTLKLEPKHWRAYNTMANYYFSEGDINKAKDNLRQASRFVNHPLILANLGTMQLCHDELDLAQDTYKSIIETSENNYLGHENLGTIFIMLGDYQKAQMHKQLAFDKQPNNAIHQVWSGLAQAHELIGDKEHAYSLYSEALAIIERDELLEVGNANDQLHKLYYRVKLNTLAPNKFFLGPYQDEVNQFISQKGDLGIKAKSHLAWLAGTVGKYDDMRLISKEISDICPVYKRSPELLNLVN